MILLYLLVAPLLSFLTLLMSGYIGFQLISKRRHIARLARPAEKTFSAHWFVRLGALSALLGPVCFAFAIWVSVDIFASQFRFICGLTPAEFCGQFTVHLKSSTGMQYMKGFVCFALI